MRYFRNKMTTGGLALVIGAGVIGAGGIVASAGGVEASAAEPATPGITATTVTVGSISDISSPVPGLFEGAKIGTEAYFAYINSQGGVNGRKLVLDARDSAFSSGTIANATQSIAKNDFAIVGGFSLLDNAEQPIIDANKLPTVTEVLNPSLYTDPNLYSAVPMVNGGASPGPTSGSSRSTLPRSSRSG